VLRLLLDEQGAPMCFDIARSSGRQQFDEAALAAVANFRYEVPSDIKAGELMFFVPISFRLQPSPYDLSPEVIEDLMQQFNKNGDPTPAKSQ
jgi:TonB family protein